VDVIKSQSPFKLCMR